MQLQKNYLTWNGEGSFFTFRQNFDYDRMNTDYF